MGMKKKKAEFSWTMAFVLMLLVLLVLLLMVIFGKGALNAVWETITNIFNAG